MYFIVPISLQPGGVNLLHFKLKSTTYKDVGIKKISVCGKDSVPFIQLSLKAHPLSFD